jgi:hypothetical protein
LNNTYVDPNYLDFLSVPAKTHYFGEPKFKMEQRKFYFDLTQEEHQYLNTLTSDVSKLHYILLSGYFHSSFTIFSLDQIDVPQDDINFICDRFKLNADKYQISRSTLNKHQFTICDLSLVSQYRSNKHRQLLIKKAEGFAKLHIKPIFIFTEIVQRLLDFGLTMPSYREFQMVISNAIRTEESRIIKLLKNIPDKINNDINELLASDKEINLTAIITLPKNVSNKEIETEIARLKRLNHLYTFTSEFIPTLKLSLESVKYYSSLVKYYGRSKLDRMSTELVKLYVICYINYRYQRINDSSAESFQALVCRYYTEAMTQAAPIVGNARSRPSI